MKSLYLECRMGVAGDMLAAALLELVDDPDAVVDNLNSLKIPGVHFTREQSIQYGVAGTHLRVHVHGQEEQSASEYHAYDVSTPEHQTQRRHAHPHRSLHDIENIVFEQLHASDAVKSDIMDVYSCIAEAESAAHACPVSEIHFHEVGSLDAIADIAAVVVLMEMLACKRIVVSPINVGKGQVRCAHGLLPVPTPATSHILSGVPIYGSVEGELCTPTGAALVKHFATEFGDMPLMTIERVGYGMGTKNFEAANCVRAFLGKSMTHTPCKPSPDLSPDPSPGSSPDEMLIELACNLDDMTPEAIAFAAETLRAAGARDVYTVSVGMKKSRAGTMLCVLCDKSKREEMLGLLFKHTSTLGIREQHCARYLLDRRELCHTSSFGNVREKVSSGYGVTRHKYEHDDLAAVARREGCSLEEVLAKLTAAK